MLLSVKVLPPLCPLLCPTVPRYLGICQFLGQLLRFLPSISVVPLYREHRRYFYVNDQTSASQWDFPTEEDKYEDLKGSLGTETQTPSQEDIKTSAPAGVPGQSFQYQVFCSVILENKIINPYSIKMNTMREGKGPRAIQREV